MPFDFGVKILAVALSVAWGTSEQAFGRRNRRAAGPTSHERHKGSFHWITASVVVGMSMAGAFGFSGVGGVTNVRVWELLGAILILVGIGALMANVIALLIAPLMTTVALVWRIRVEERAMAEHFGTAYEEYCKSTWRLLPLVW